MVEDVMPWGRGTVVCALVCVACGTDEITHGVDEGPSESTTFSASATSGAATTEQSPSSSAGNVIGDTNFPEPAVTACGGVEGNKIEDLISAWGVRALPGANVPEGSVRLRFSQQPTFDCRERFKPFVCEDTGGQGSSGIFGGSSTGGVGGSCGWAFAFTLTKDELLEDTLDFATLTDPDFELVSEDAMPPFETITGTLEIRRTPQDCVVGKIVDLRVDGGFHPRFDGHFAVQVCDSACVPTTSRSCS